MIISRNPNSIQGDLCPIALSPGSVSTPRVDSKPLKVRLQGARAQPLVDLQQISAEEAVRHPMRHVLIRSLGGQYRDVEGDFQRVGLSDGDQLLLCTDGLTNMVDDAAIASLLDGAATSNKACQALVAAALEKGGKDNVTVAL